MVASARNSALASRNTILATAAGKTPYLQPLEEREEAHTVGAILKAQHAQHKHTPLRMSYVNGQWHRNNYDYYSRSGRLAGQLGSALAR